MIYKSLNEYKLFEMILEGKLFFSPMILKLFKSIYSDERIENKIRYIAEHLYLLNNRETKEDYTLIDLSKNDGYFTYTTSKNLLRKGFDIESSNPGQINKLWDDENRGLSETDYWKKSRSEIKIIKLINKLLENPTLNLSESDKERFLNVFKSKLQVDSNFKIVEGREIIRYYSSDYTKEKKGTLGNSCMLDKNEYILQIYVDNPSVCKLLVLLDEEDKVIGRAILWQVAECSNPSIKKFMDRYYTISDHLEYKFKEWAQENGYHYKRNNTYDSVREIYNVEKRNYEEVEMTIKLETKDEFSRYPYLDTFKLFDPHNNTLKNSLIEHIKKSNLYFNNANLYLNSPYGSFETVGPGIWSRHFDSYITRDYVYSEYMDSILPKDRSVNVQEAGWVLKDSRYVVFSKIYDKWLLSSRSSHIGYMNDYVPSHETGLSIEYSIRLNKTLRDYCWIKDENFIPLKIDKFSKLSQNLQINILGTMGDDEIAYYKKDELIKIGKYYSFKEITLDVYKVIGEDLYLTDFDAKWMNKKINKVSKKMDIIDYIYENEDIIEVDKWINIKNTQELSLKDKNIINNLINYAEDL